MQFLSIQTQTNPDFDQLWQSWAFNDSDSLAWSASQWPTSGQFSPLPPFILSMHLFHWPDLGGRLKGLWLCAWFFRQIPLLYCSSMLWYPTQASTTCRRRRRRWKRRRVKPVWEAAVSSCASATCCLTISPIRPQIRHFFNESHNSGYWAIWDSLSSPSFHQT